MSLIAMEYLQFMIVNLYLGEMRGCVFYYVQCSYSSQQV